MVNFRRIHYVKFVSSLFLIVFFIFVIVYADKFSKGEEQLAIDSSFIQGDDGISHEINMDAISINVDNNNNGTIQYIVQPGDTLLKIASTFGTTVSNIQKNNALKGEVQAGQTLKILNNDEGIVYTMKEKNNVVVFANKYNLNIQDLMTLNYLQNETEILNPGQEVFINISNEKSYEIGLVEKPKPVIIAQTTVTYKPTINKPSQGGSKKPSTTKKPSSTSTSTAANDDSSDNTKSVIISKRTYTKKIKNSFYPGYCTRYAAIISPSIFPYTDELTQERTFGGDARQWCANAKEAGFSVGSKPSAGALIVYGTLRSSAGHVGKVINYYPDDGKMIIREMNYLGKFVVDERWENVDNSKIKCYIYGK